MDDLLRLAGSRPGHRQTKRWAFMGSRHGHTNTRLDAAQKASRRALQDLERRRRAHDIARIRRRMSISLRDRAAGFTAPHPAPSAGGSASIRGVAASWMRCRAAGAFTARLRFASVRKATSSTGANQGDRAQLFDDLLRHCGKALAWCVRWGNARTDGQGENAV